MVFLPSQSAASASFAAMLFLSVAGFLVLSAIGQHSHRVHAFQLHSRCFGSRKRPLSTSIAARRDDVTCGSSLPQKTKTNRNKHSDDIAQVWANSLEHKIPWHASSRRYLSDGLPALDPS